MEFEWDESKWSSNIRKHGIDFLNIPDVFTKKLGLKPRRSRAALIDYMYFMVDMVS